MTFPRAVCLVVVALAITGCATTPSVGVRQDYARHTLRSVAVTPATSQSRFGMRESEWQTIRATYERQTLEELSRLGLRVVSPDQLERDLRARGAWQTFTEVLVPRGEIESRFEPTLWDEEPPLEVVALRKLHADSALPAEAVLVTEIVYQSEGTCDEDPREYSRHAVVVGDPEVASPCIVSHFEAKLVDPATGSTMWHNRQLRERRVPEVDRQARITNIRETVTATIAGPHGLGPLAGPG